MVRAKARVWRDSTMKTVFYNAKIIRGGSIISGHAAIADGLVFKVGEGLPGEEFKGWEQVDLKGDYLSPGFIDTHCHGGGGHDFLDGSVEAIVGAARAHMEHGTTTIAPTSLSCADEDLFAFFENYKKALLVTERMPNLMGIHLEGPFFSVEQAGAQPPHYLKNPTIEYAEEVLRRAEGNIIRWSMAPELPGAMETGDWLSEHGVMISIAHTDAEYPVISEAVQHGFTHMTHFYSGMGMLRRRNAFRVLGAVECGYLFDELNIEIIADGMHLPPELLKLILKCKPNDKITLVTDSMRGAGMPDGPSVLGNMKDGVPVMLDGGIAKLLDLSAFAGSVATTDRLVRVMVKQAGLSVPEAVAMITENVARQYAIWDSVGSIDPGKRADLVVFDDNINVSRVYVRGNQVV